MSLILKISIQRTIDHRILWSKFCITTHYKHIKNLLKHIIHNHCSSECYEGEESELTENGESEESLESESDKISVLYNYGNEHDRSNSKYRINDINQSESPEEDKYSVTVKAGNKIVERTVEQVITNTKTFQRFQFKANKEIGDESSEDEPPYNSLKPALRRGHMMRMSRSRQGSNVSLTDEGIIPYKEDFINAEKFNMHNIVELGPASYRKFEKTPGMNGILLIFLSIE